MKKIIKIMAIALVFIVLAFGGCVYFFAPRPPKERELIRNFNDQRAAFEQLREMLQADTNLSRVASWGVETRKPFFLGYPSQVNFPTNRFNKYLTLLKKAGGLAADRNQSEHADPNILVWGSGWAGDTRHIWIGWLEEPPTNPVASFTGYLEYSTNAEVIFKHIDHNWYLGSDGAIPSTR